MSMPGSLYDDMDLSSGDSDFIPQTEESEVDGFDLEIDLVSDEADEDEADMEDATANATPAAANNANDDEISFEVDPRTNHIYINSAHGRMALTQGALRQSPALAALLRQFLTNPSPDAEVSFRLDPQESLIAGSNHRVMKTRKILMTIYGVSCTPDGPAARHLSFPSELSQIQKERHCSRVANLAE
jgi:hypothetical protein